MTDSDIIKKITSGEYGKNEVLRYLAECPDKEYFRDEILVEHTRMMCDKNDIPIIPNGGIINNYNVDAPLAIEAMRLFDALQWIDEALQQLKHAEQHEALKRGISIGAFIDLMNGEDEERQKNLKILHSLMTGKKGRKCAMIIVAAVKAGIMHKPSFEYVRDEFMDVGSKSNYYKYLNSTGGAAPFTDEELAPIIHKITSKNE